MKKRRHLIVGISKIFLIGFIVLLLNINILSGCNTPTNSLSYRIDKETYIMYVSGNGEMKDKKVIDEWKKPSLLPDKLVIESGITSIADRAFAHYEEDDSHSTLYDKPLAFGELREVVLPDTLETIGEGAFEDCDKLKTINLPKSLKHINQRAFSNCVKLDNVTIPGRVDYISDDAFKNCKLNYLNIENGVRIIGEGAFSGCELKSIKLPDSITQINHAFCFSDLEEIILSKKISEIGEGAFYGCDELNRIDLPNNITSIGVESFAECEKLDQISLPEKLEKIGEEAFIGTKIKTITIPKSVKIIGEKSFGYNSYCKKMKNVSIKGYKGTAAEKYAKKNKFKFIAL